ncbi:MAG: M3 family oligoendopeptidase [Bacteroidota bacterium]
MLLTNQQIHVTIKRSYIPESLVINAWKDVETYFNELLNRELNNKEDLWKWMKDRSELESVLQEDLGWRYIKMSCDTASEEFKNSFNFFVSEIQPHIAPLSNNLDTKMIESPFLDQLTNKGLDIYLRQVKKRIEIYRDENVPLFAELQQKEQEYAVITGAMTIVVDGKELTLQQASNFLREPDREKREMVFRKIAERRLQDRDKLDNLFDELLKIRHQVALNSGFENFRDYMFAALGRFDYTPEDCYAFHQSIAEEVVPVCNDFDLEQKELIGVDTLRPWDTEAEPAGRRPLQPFTGAADLVEKTITCFGKLDPSLAECIKALDTTGHFDLESRKGKAPGGYNYPLYESGLPFIFMNSTDNLRDLVTMVHEGGHAIHSIVTRDLDLVDYKSLPSEVAELASMSMELLSMEYWDEFFKDEKELQRARKHHLEKVLEALPWIAAVDAFQHWIYTNPTHTADDRRKEWNVIYKKFNGNITDWSGLEEIRDNIWQRQLHIFEVPFYYIEYGMAQLGALAVWRNFRNDNSTGLRKYIDALSLGYRATINDIYKTAGIRFDFSKPYIRELTAFVKDQLKQVSETV